MKIEEVNKEKEFQPIELKITIESEEELCNLWHRFNVGRNQILEGSTTGVVKYEPLHSNDDWDVIDEIFEARGLKH
jgi:hypothetical protein